jgi:hypothetical protein
MLQQAIQAVGGATSGTPRTILGFLWGVLLLLLSSGVAVIGFAVGHEKLYYLIPSVVIGGVAFAAMEVVAVLVIAVFDPTKLMLSQISGEEYIKHRQVILGDSASGERAVTVPSPSALAVVEATAQEETGAEGGAG